MHVMRHLRIRVHRGPVFGGHSILVEGLRTGNDGFELVVRNQGQIGRGAFDILVFDGLR